ncbi:hypothetical protein Taro_027758 [Colocasia esculenta]|uniref:Uncharacterized protein n=1 Tax=Colocasia esculenta TaxID=4460 RepID=A0A843VPQ9_COLES|nr:hypothetical protein [Colocasia esculenta]
MDIYFMVDDNVGVPVLEGDIVRSDFEREEELCLWRLLAMVSHGRHSTQAREDEQRCEERGEQQAPAPQGPTVLPPPPPMDYGMPSPGDADSAQTQAALQAQLQAHAQAPAPVPQEHGDGGPSIMERFKRMAPPSFKGESQPLLAESWMREVEKIFRAIRCAEEDKVSLATYMLQERADVWWAFMLRMRYEDVAIEDRKKAVVYQSLQHLVAASSKQAVVPHPPVSSPGTRRHVLIALGHMVDPSAGI